MKMGVQVTLRNAILLAAVAALALLLAACGGGSSSGDSGGPAGSGGEEGAPAKGGVLTVAQGSEVISLDPQVAVDPVSINVLSQIMEPLYKADADGKIEPWLATGATTSKDERTWTFELRQGVEFSDGKPLTAEDVVFSIDTAREGANWGALFEAVTAVEAPSSSKVVIKVKHPLPAMEALLSSYATVIVPKDYGGVSAKAFAANPVGTGPFELGAWQHGQSLTLAANPRYWEKDQPYLNKVVFHNVADDSSRVAQLRGGELDVIASPPFSQIASLEQVPGIEVGEYALSLSKYVTLNAENELFEDPRVREAVNLAIDRDGIIETGLAGHGQTGGSFLSPAVPFHDASIEPPARDVAKAKQLLAEAVADGADPSFTLLLEAGVTFQTLASQIVQQDLEEVGFTVKLQPLDPSALLEQLAGGEYEASLSGLYPNVLDPSENVFFYIATEALFSKADTTKLSKLAEEGSSTSAPAERRAIYDRIQEEVDKANYTITLGYEPWIWATQEDVVGFAVNPLDIAWFAEAGFSE